MCVYILHRLWKAQDAECCSEGMSNCHRRTQHCDENSWIFLDAADQIVIRN